jgi:hypothetical protein
MRTVAFVLAVGAAACSHKASSSLDEAESAKLLINRNWLDRMPETERDRLHVYRFVPDMGGGVYQDRTLYKGTFELFTFTVEGDRIRFVLPETGDEVTSHFSIEAVDGPKPFDLKLSVSDDPRGPHVYYGMRRETDRDGHVLEQELREATGR